MSKALFYRLGVSGGHSFPSIRSGGKAVLVTQAERQRRVRVERRRELQTRETARLDEILGAAVAPGLGGAVALGLGGGLVPRQ